MVAGNARLSVITEVNPRFCSFGSRLLKSMGSAAGMTIKGVCDGAVVVGDAVASRPALLPIISERVLIPLTSNVLRRPIVRVVDFEEDLDDGGAPAPGEELPITKGKLDLLSYDFLHKRNMLFGTPEYVIDKIHELKSELNLQNLQVWSNFPGIKHEDCMKSIKLFTEKVMPHFKDDIDTEVKKVS